MLLASAPAEGTLSVSRKTKKRRRGRGTGKEVRAARAATNVPVMLLNRHEVTAAVGLSYVTIWKMAKAGKFPRGRTLGGKTVWRSDEVTAWLNKLPLAQLRVEKAA